MNRPTHDEAMTYTRSHLIDCGYNFEINRSEDSSETDEAVDVYFDTDEGTYCMTVWYEEDGSLYGEW